MRRERRSQVAAGGAPQARATYLAPPDLHRLNWACRPIAEAFGEPPFLVGSALIRPNFRNNRSDVLGLALQRAEIDLLKNGMQVDLRAIVAGNRTKMTFIRKWARMRLAADPNGSGWAIAGSAVQELAILSDCTDHELVDELLKFSPQRAPQATSRRQPA